MFFLGGKVRDEEGYTGFEGLVDMGETPMLHAMILAMTQGPFIGYCNKNILLVAWAKVNAKGGLWNQ